MEEGRGITKEAHTYSDETGLIRKKKALRIAIIVFVGLFLISIGTRILIGEYVFSKTIGVFEEAIAPMIGDNLGRQLSGERINITSVEEANNLIKQVRQHQIENYNRLKAGQPAVFYTFTELCVKNGVTKEINDYNREEFCDEGGGNMNCGNCTRLGEKATSVENLSDAITTLFAESILLLLVDNVNDVATKLDKEKEGGLDVIGATLSVLQVVSKVTITWADVIPMITEGKNHSGGNTIREQYFLWDESPQEKLAKVEEFANRLPEVTEDQINALNFKDICVDQFVQTYKTNYNRLGLFSAAMAKVMSSRSLIPEFEDSCKLVEEHEKNVLINTLRRSQVETIPSMKIIQKYYLSMVVNCPTIIYDREASKNCDFSEKFTSLYNEIFGVVQEERN